MSELSTAVFLSYASEDAPAAARICAALRDAGIEVWFDKSELRGGDAWDRQIRERIQGCRLFIAVISAGTDARDEGYFRREWSLAVERTRDMADTKTFLIPVVIDDTTERGATVPDKFRGVQWTHLPDGETPKAFVDRIAALLGSEPRRATTAAHTPGPAAATNPPRPARSRRSLGPWLGVIAILGAIGIGWFAWRQARIPASHSNAATQAAADVAKSVAVLPFVDMSEKHDQEYFSDGLSEELIDVLTQVPGLRVPARTSSFSFKNKSVTVGEIARTLSVGHVLEGSVRKSGDRLRVTAQLVRADDGFHEWSQTYDRDVHDVFAVQDDIARTVAAQLSLTISEGAKSAHDRNATPEAYNLYLQARFRTERDTPEDLNAAVDLYQRAIAITPEYAAPWAWLAYCQSRRISNGDTSEATYRSARSSAERAIALDPKLVEGYVAGAIAAMQYSLDWQASQQLLDAGLAQDPNAPLALQFRAHLTQATGSIADAEGYMRRAVALDPLDALTRRYLARIVLSAGRAQESAEILKQTIEQNPAFPGLHYELGRALLVAGKPVEAAAAYEAELSQTWRDLGLPIAYHATHRDALAQAALTRLVANSAGAEFQVAEAYAFFGQPERAFEWLEHARERHDAGLIYVRRDPLLASLAGDPRFPAFLRRIHLPE